MSSSNERVYTIGIPLCVTVSDEGSIVFDFDLAEVASADLDPVEYPVADEQVYLADLAKIGVACQARDNSHTFTARVVEIEP